MESKRVQLHVSEGTLARLEDMAQSLMLSKSKTCSILLQTGLDEREKLFELLSSWVTNALGRAFLVGRVQPKRKPGKKVYIQINLPEGYAEKLESVAAAMDQTVARCGGWILECAVENNGYFLEAFGPMFGKMQAFFKNRKQPVEDDGLDHAAPAA